MATELEKMRESNTYTNLLILLGLLFVGLYIAAKVDNHNDREALFEVWSQPCKGDSTCIRKAREVSDGCHARHIRRMPGRHTPPAAKQKGSYYKCVKKHMDGRIIMPPRDRVIAAF